MADQKISDLTALTTPDNADVFAIVDTDAVETKKITWQNIYKAAVTYIVELQPVLAGTDVATGDLNGNVVFRVPAELNGWDLVSVGACVTTAGTTGTTDIQIHNITQAADMLSTKITIDSTETDSKDATAPPVIDTTNDDVATGDQIRVDVDAVSTTAPKGLVVTLGFRLP